MKKRVRRALGVNALLMLLTGLVISVMGLNLSLETIGEFVTKALKVIGILLAVITLVSLFYLIKVADGKEMRFDLKTDRLNKVTSKGRGQLIVLMVVLIQSIVFVYPIKWLYEAMGVIHGEKTTLIAFISIMLLTILNVTLMCIRVVRKDSVIYRENVGMLNLMTFIGSLGVLIWFYQWYISTLSILVFVLGVTLILTMLGKVYPMIVAQLVDNESEERTGVFNLGCNIHSSWLFLMGVSLMDNLIILICAMFMSPNNDK